MPILSEEDLERFRTKVCTLASSLKCDFGVERCNYSHNLYWARRCPFYLRDSSILRYIPQCCPDVELDETRVLRNGCPRGNNCSFAHSQEEIIYHPLVYKTKVCKDYRLGKCKTYYCHMVHGLAEFRQPREFVLPRKKGIAVPELQHVTLVDSVKGCKSERWSSRSYEGSGDAIQTLWTADYSAEVSRLCDLLKETCARGPPLPPLGDKLQRLWLLISKMSPETNQGKLKLSPIPNGTPNNGPENEPENEAVRLAGLGIDGMRLDGMRLDGMRLDGMGEEKVLEDQWSSWNAFYRELLHNLDANEEAG